MRLLERRRRPCFWVLGDNRCGPSISWAKEMVLGTNREDLEVLVASVTGEGEVEGGGKRSVGMKVAHGPELRTGERSGGSASESRGSRSRSLDFAAIV
jgi:hypothetical protein